MASESARQHTDQIPNRRLSSLSSSSSSFGRRNPPSFCDGNSGVGKAHLDALSRAVNETSEFFGKKQSNRSRDDFEVLSFLKYFSSAFKV